MLSGPTCKALEQLLPQFTEKTGIPVRLMEAGYDELYRTVKMCAQSSPYDLIRLDMAWMSELGEALFSPCRKARAGCGRSWGIFPPAWAKTITGWGTSA